MALRLLAILISLAIVWSVPRLARWRDDRWFRGWVSRLSDLSGPGRVAVVLLVPVIAAAIIAGVLRALPFFDLAWLAFAIVVLTYALGPREIETDIDAILRASDTLRRDEALIALRHDEETLPWFAPALVEAAFYGALRRRFGVLLWFLLLGPAGALGYRLAQLLGRDASLSVDTDTRTAARRLADALDWIPAHLMVFAMALVSDFDAVMGAWKQWHRTSGSPRSRLDPDFLGAVARAGVDADVEAGDGYAQDVSDPVVELEDARRVIRRVLVVWLAVVALIVLAAWVA
ncbi:MAG: cobalamin biosynthesis protein [Luteibacter sp.]|uniref:cobalamin biosynthesis protein n=1 Tax=Luteibacter TaxID=242605 RepID=UPI00056B0A20|nr:MULTISPECIES: cobalamin biosynthesis protein [unclassified Luteibacter]MDQ7994291.1 cobalamin biosynthesis protein [Luteibacter sp.]MDQ8048591.1 cobalamin biosynthesis protein [Luteibacter sp.]